LALREINFPVPEKPKDEINGLSVAKTLIVNSKSNIVNSNFRIIFLYFFHHFVKSKIVIVLNIKANAQAIQRTPSLKKMTIAHNKTIGIILVLFFSKIIQRIDEAIQTKGKVKRAIGATKKNNKPIGGTIIIKGATKSPPIKTHKKAINLMYFPIFSKH